MDETLRPVLAILKRFTAIHFKNRTFSISALELPATLTFFEKSTFKKSWLVFLDGHETSLVEEGGVLFDACAFNDGVTLAERNVNTEVLRHYSGFLMTALLSI